MINSLASFAESRIGKLAVSSTLVASLWMADVRDAVAQVLGEKTPDMAVHKEELLPELDQLTCDALIHDLADEVFLKREKAFGTLMRHADEPVILRTLRKVIAREEKDPLFDQERKNRSIELQKFARKTLRQRHFKETAHPDELLFEVPPESMKLPPNLTRWGPKGGEWDFWRPAVLTGLFSIATPVGRELTKGEYQKLARQFLELYEQGSIDHAEAIAKGRGELHRVMADFGRHRDSYVEQLQEAAGKKHQDVPNLPQR